MLRLLDFRYFSDKSKRQLQQNCSKTKLELFSSRKSGIMAPRRGAAWKKPSDNPPAVGGCGREAQEEREPQGIGG